jgi:hypothetical protein
MDVAALIGSHQGFAPHARAEMRNDDRHGGKARGNRGQRERIAQTKVEGRWQPKLLSYAHRQHAAVREHHRLVLSRRGKDLSHSLVVQFVGVHRGKEANAA